MQTSNSSTNWRSIQPLRNAALCAALALVISACQTISPVENPPPIAPVVNTTTQVQPIQTQSTPVAEVPAETEEDKTVDLWNRIRNGFKLQTAYSHPSVQRYIDTYGSNQRLFDLVTERAAPFLFYIVDEIEERGLPMELALLPIVESTFNPNAYSQEHAVGLWQFIGPTARSFGVDLNWWYDGRRDPLVSTPAALEYLAALHAQFNEDWLVAIGAYNTGDGNVRRAIRRSKQDPKNIDFWTLPLAPETRSHVPKLLALAAIVENIELYDVVLEPIANHSTHTLVQLPAQMDINQAALLIDIDYAELQRLNPGYLQWATHPDAPHSLFVPNDKVETLIKEVNLKDASELLTWDRYAIQNGDSLSAIARKLGTRVDILMHANNLQSSAIVAGASLLVPRNVTTLSSLQSIPRASYPVSRDNITVPKNYTIRSGDNLWSIARKYNLKSVDIARANNLAMTTVLQPGQKLDLSYATGAYSETTNNPTLATLDKTIYRVSRGDSIAGIAKKYGQSIRDLLLWNDLTETQLIHPGQEIRLVPPDAGIN